MLINTRNFFLTNNFLLYHVFESSIATTEKKLQIDLTCSSVSIVNVEHVIAGWERAWKNYLEQSTRIKQNLLLHNF